MNKLATAIAALVCANAAQAACPAYLDHDLRKLHSKDMVNLCEMKGNALLVVNTASHCGYTRQLKDLEAVYQKYQERGLTVVGFASDDFRQAAKSEEEAATICYVNYGVTFPMLAPTSVKGDAANPVFSELASRTVPPSWNFNKYVIDRSGNVVTHFDSNTAPTDPVLLKTIEGAL